MPRKPDRIKRSLSLFYLAILAGIFLAVLTVNGFLEVNRTKNGFYHLLEREGNVLLLHFEGNIEEALASLQTVETHPDSLANPSSSGFLYGLDESAAEYLLDAAHRVDRMDTERPLSASDLESLAGQYLLASIEIYDAQGRLLRGIPLPTGSIQREPMLRDLMQQGRPVFIDLFEKPLFTARGPSWFSIAIWRKSGPGIIALHLNGKQMRELFRQFAIQKAISDMGLREGIVYISVQDSSLNTVAHTDSSLIGTKQEDPFLRNSLQAGAYRSRFYTAKKGEEIFEVSKSFFVNQTPAGLIRIGFSSRDIQPILSQIKKNVFLSILSFLALGISAITLIWVNQNRHLRRLREMEDRIQRAERLSSLGHLAAGVAHEIRNPLNAIGIGLQRLKREFSPQDETRKEEYTSFTELIFKEVRRVNGIIEQFLTLSRPFQLNRMPTSLRELLKNMVRLFEGEAASRGVRIETEMDTELPLLNVDGEKLTQAFLNIMKNGIQAMEQGGVFRIETRRLREWTEVVLSDSGSGIPPDQMEKIFNYYYTTKKDGLGLGLPIAHRIVEAHGGQLKVESQVGKGTKVTVTLPMKKVR